MKKQSYMGMPGPAGIQGPAGVTIDHLYINAPRCPLCNCPVIRLGEGEYIYYKCAATQTGSCTYQEDLPWMSIEDYAKKYMYPAKGITK